MSGLSTIIPPYRMDPHQHQALLRMFNDPRGLHPWIPEHDIFIRGEIAKLEILDPHDAESKKEFYAKKMADYEASNKAVVEDEKAQEVNRKEEFAKEAKARAGIVDAPVEPVEVTEEEVVVKVKKPAKKKKVK